MANRIMPRQIIRRNALKRLLKKAQKEFGKKDLSVLEIGYGSGHFFDMYASLGLKPFGYDFSEKAYNRALQQKAVKNGNAVLYKALDEVPLARFDVVIACEVLEHCEDDLGQLSKWKEYLNDNGGGQLLLFLFRHTQKDGMTMMFMAGTIAATQKTRLAALCAPAA